MKARFLTFDVESYRTRSPAIIERIAEQVRDARPANNVAREIKTTWDEPEMVQSRIDAAIAKTALDPLYADILCICASRMEGNVIVLDGMERSTSKMLLEMTDLIAEWCDRETLFVGHNIEGFDLPLLLAQFQKHAITPPEVFPTYRRGRWRGNVFDTMGACPGKTPFISLVDAALAYRFEAKGMKWKGERMTGARVGEAYEAGDFQIIREYCCGDVHDETTLFMRQTCGGTWGIQSRMDATAEQLQEIAESSHLTPAQRWLAAVPILHSYGLLK